MIVCLMITALALAIVFPERLSGPWIRDLIFKAYKVFVAQTTLSKLIFFTSFILAVFSLGVALPAEAALFAAFDVATYMEVVAAVWLLNSRVQLGKLIRLSVDRARFYIAEVVVSFVMRLRNMRMSRRHRKKQKPPRSADDRPGGYFAFSWNDLEAIHR